MDVAHFAQSHPVIAFAVVGLIFVVAYRTASTKRSYPEGLPWIGKKDGTLFSTSRATLNSLFNVEPWLEEGYQKFSQKGQTYIFPDFSGRHELVLPNDKLKWITDHGDDVISARAAHYDQLQGEYAFTDKRLVQNVFHEHVLHKNLFRKIDSVIPAIHDELVDSIDTIWGTGSEWKEITLFRLMMDVVARVSNRMFVGLPLCRNEDFLRNNAAFAEDAIRAVALMPFFPLWTHPVIGHLMCLPNHYHAWRARKHTLPAIKQRLVDIEEKASNPDSKVEIPEDYITWHIRLARDTGNQLALDPVMISRYIMPVEFASIHTTTMASTMALFDLFSSDPTKGFVDGIREECTRALSESNGVWDKKALTKLIRTDSAIRESLRVSNFGTRSIQRKVVAKDGLHNEAEGWTAPFGSYLSVNEHSRHHDPNVYPDPNTYDAFRFSRQREEFEALHPGALNSDEYLKMKNLNLISTGENFLAFGHGRHACPGRFLVQHEIKMMIAHIVMNYEVQTLPVRPPNQWMGTAICPPMSAKLTVRRRVESAK